MPEKGKVKVGIIGSQFEADIHAVSFQLMPEEAEVVAIASPTPGNAEKLAKKYGIPRVFLDYREMLKEQDIEMVTITAPNRLHAQMTIDIANAGKHVVCEKPLCVTLAEADEMIDTCKRKGVMLGYAEELFFTPKYVKAKEMADQGGFGKIHLVKQSEKHFGPHSPWFWDMEQAGGGAMMDLGCHGIAFCYWFLGRPAIKTVYAQLGTYVHKDKTKGDDEGVLHPRIREWRGRHGRSELGKTRRDDGSDRDLRRRRSDLCRPPHGQRASDVQRVRIWLRGGEGADHQRVELAGLRRALELRNSPGNAALCTRGQREGKSAGLG